MGFRTWPRPQLAEQTCLPFPCPLLEHMCTYYIAYATLGDSQPGVVLHYDDARAGGAGVTIRQKPDEDEDEDGVEDGSLQLHVIVRQSTPFAGGFFRAGCRVLLF